MIILVAVSCTKPGTEPGNKSSSGITINNFPDNADTIQVNFHSVLNVRIGGAQFQKYAVKVFSQGVLMLKDSSYNGTFYISVDRLFLTTGSYNTRFEIFGGASNQTLNQILLSGTNINQRQVVIRFTGFTPIPEPLLAEKNGTLAGSFNKILQIKALAVTKFYNYSNTEVRVDSVTATGNGEMVFSDHSYVGENAYYTLTGYQTGDSAGLFFSGSGSANKPNELTPHQVYSDANGRPVIQWNKNRYYQNFGSYRIRKKKSYGNSILLKEITDINDTVQSTLDLGFPGSIDIYVTHLPKVNLQYIPPELEMEEFGYGVTYRPGNPIHPFDECESPRGNDIYLHEDNENYLYRYSALTRQKVDSIYCSDGRFSVSANNRYVLTMRDNRFHLYNVTNGQDLSVLISDFLPVADVNDFDVSDNGRMTVMNGFSNLKLIDVVHNQLLGTLSMTNGTLNQCQISGAGDYVYVYTEYKNRIYRFSGGTFTEIFNIGDVGFSTLEFMADQPDKVVLIRPTGYDIYNLVTKSTELSVPFPGFMEFSVDYNDYQIMTEDDNFYKIYDLNTGTLVKSIIHNSTSHFTYLHSHTIFHGAGRWMTFQ